LSAGATISVRIGIPDDALHVGGMNLFGSKFGNHAQDVLLRCRFRRT
jgi:predicted transcriptional regulator